MRLIYTLPIIEVLVFNLITLNSCCRRKYSLFKTIAIICIFTVLCILPGPIFLSSIFVGDGRWAIFGFLYIIPLKFLYHERTDSIVLNMCMSWTYTLGIMAISVQIAYLFNFENHRAYLVAVETILFLATFFPFNKYVIPKYCYIFQNIDDFKKSWFKYLSFSVYLNFLLLLIIHTIFLGSGASLLKIVGLVIFLGTAYSSYAIVYEIIRGSVKIDELEKAASHDPLTGLGNRAQMLSRMRILMEENQVFSVMFLDLDKFKLINDEYGHAVGDQYLIHFGKVCSAALKDNGKLYRYGGDEFVALYYGAVSEDEARLIAKCEKWNDGAPCPFNDVSVGVVACHPPYGNNDPSPILKRADSIMYKNKLNKKAKMGGGKKLNLF